MRPFMTTLLVLAVVVPAFATDYTITSGYYGTKTYQNWDTLLMTGGGINNVTAEDYSVLKIMNTSNYVPFSGGIGSLNLWGSSNLIFSGGQINTFSIYGSATAVLSSGLINKIYSYQSVTTPNYMQHIEMICKEYNFNTSTKLLTGTWANDSTFSIQLMNQTGYAAVIDNIEFTIIPEPATMLLIGLGGLFLRRKQK